MQPTICLSVAFCVCAVLACSSQRDSHTAPSLIPGGGFPDGGLDEPEVPDEGTDEPEISDAVCHCVIDEGSELTYDDCAGETEAICSGRACGFLKEGPDGSRTEIHRTCAFTGLPIEDESFDPCESPAQTCECPVESGERVGWNYCKDPGGFEQPLDMCTLGICEVIGPTGRPSIRNCGVAVHIPPGCPFPETPEIPAEASCVCPSDADDEIAWNDCERTGDYDVNMCTGSGCAIRRSFEPSSDDEGPPDAGSYEEFHWCEVRIVEPL
jgi:hypothetical protein